MASVKWSETALQDIGELDTVVGKRVVEKVEWLRQNFVSVTPDRLRWKLIDLYKVRVGDYRVIYSIRGELLVIEAVRHRRGVYD